MAEKSWRQMARPLITEVLQATRGQSEREIKKALREAFPWPPREKYPYQVWLDEIRRQRGLKKPGQWQPGKGKPRKVDRRQLSLMEEADGSRAG